MSCRLRWIGRLSQVCAVLTEGLPRTPGRTSTAGDGVAVVAVVAAVAGAEAALAGA